MRSLRGLYKTRGLLVNIVLTAMFFLSAIYLLTWGYPVQSMPNYLAPGVRFEDYMQTDWDGDRLRSWNQREMIKMMLSNEEPQFAREGTEKKIIYYSPDKKKTKYSVIYLHGFSATRQELSPVPEKLAEKLQANLFMTRLSGHGQSGKELAYSTPQGWLQDAQEALKVGQAIGEQVVVLGFSTGASLGLYLASKFPRQIAWLCLGAPNFRPRNPFSVLLTGPLGPTAASLFIGENYSFKPSNELQAKYWTTQYPAIAVVNMMELIKIINHIRLDKIHTPMTWFYTPHDEVLSVDLMHKKFRELGSPQKKMVSIDHDGHILAGDIMAPENTQRVVDLCFEALD